MISLTRLLAFRAHMKSRLVLQIQIYKSKERISLQLKVESEILIKLTWT